MTQTNKSIKIILTGVKIIFFQPYFNVYVCEKC